MDLQGEHYDNLENYYLNDTSYNGNYDHCNNNFDNNNCNNDESGNLTEEEINEIKKEPSDITDKDIPQEIPSLDKLQNLKEILEKSPRDEVSQLLANLLPNNNGFNPINPNNNKYTMASKNDMLRVRLQQTLKRKKDARLPKKHKDDEYKKQIESMRARIEKLKKDKQDKST